MLARIERRGIEHVQLPGVPSFGDKLEMSSILSIAMFGNDSQVYPIMESIDENVGWEQVNRSGKIAKRIRKYFKSIGFPVVSDEALSKVSIILKESESKEREYTVDVTDNFNWEDGDFGHGGSCWWDGGDFYYSRNSLDGAGGYALRFYRNVPRYSNYSDWDGIGRIWILPYKNRILLFNAYGDGVDLGIGAKILQSLFPELSNKSISRWHRASCSAMYVNDDRVLVIHDLDDVLEDRIDIDIECIYDGPYGSETTCYNCGDSISGDDIYHMDGDEYCESCYYDLFFNCAHCNDDYSQDDVMISPNGESVCPRCFHRYYKICDECGESIDNDYAYELDEHYYCESCLMDVSITCSECDELCHSRNSLELSNGEFACDDCAKFCNVCKSVVLSDDYNNQFRMCRECLENKNPVVIVTSHCLTRSGRYYHVEDITINPPSNAIACPHCNKFYTSYLYREAYSHIAECTESTIAPIPNGQIPLEIG